MAKIHETAIVEEGANLERGVSIGAYSIIGKNVKIGSDTIVESHCVIEGDTTIGKDNHVYSFASIGKPPQDLKYNNEKTKVIIGNNNKIREFITIHRGTTDKYETKIGNDNLLMAYVHIAHDVLVGNSCILANGVNLAGHVEVGDKVVIGGLSAVHQFARLGAYAMIGGKSAVTLDIAPFVLAEGNKARLRGLNLVGLRRRGFSKEDISILKKAYRVIFKSKVPLRASLRELSEAHGDNENIKYLISFIKKSSRGITR